MPFAEVAVHEKSSEPNLQNLLFFLKRIKTLHPLETRSSPNIGVRPHKEKINISKEIINKTRRAVAPYAARMNHTSLRGEQQATVLWLAEM